MLALLCARITDKRRGDRIQTLFDSAKFLRQAVAVVLNALRLRRLVRHHGEVHDGAVIVILPSFVVV